MAPVKYSGRTDTLIILSPSSSSGLSRMRMICRRAFGRSLTTQRREQSLAPVVAQADELVSRHRQCIGKTATLAQARVVGAPRRVAADENLIGADDTRGIQCVAPHHLAP